MSIMLAAADLGIGSAHAAVSDQELARWLLRLPEDRFCAWLITLGVPPIARSSRSSGPTGTRSKRSCTATTGSKNDDPGLHAQVLGDGASSAAAIVAVSASSLVKTTSPL
jgi:hypothetical protein